MKSLTRRDLLKGSVVGALSAAAGALIADTTPERHDAEPYRVNLICSGMLGYYYQYNKKDVEGNEHHSFRILIPHKRMADEDHDTHVVRFGRRVGGDPLAGGRYRLELPNHSEPWGDPYPVSSSKTGSSTKTGSSSKTDIIFGRDDSGNWTNRSLKVRPNGHYAEIVLHKPTCVLSARTISKCSPGNTNIFFECDAYDLNINPDTFPGVYILVYENVKGPVRLIGPENQTLHRKAGAPYLNLHLYCERPPKGDPGDHLDLFNRMFLRTDGDPAFPLMLNMCTSSRDARGHLGDAVAFGDFSADDLKTLPELSGEKGPDLPLCPRKADPAGCAVGWVYSPDITE